MANNSTHVFTVSSEVLVFSIIFKFIAMGVGVTGNIAVVICKTIMEKEQTATSYLVTNLALADLVTCLTFYPIWIVEFIKTVLGNESDQMFFCKSSRSSSWMMLFVSTATLFAITLDRYLFIVKPLRYPVLVTRQRVLPFILAIWVTGCGIFILYILNYGSYPRYRSLCYVSYDIGWSTTILTSYIPIILLFILNFKLLTVAHKQRKRIVAEAATVNATNDNEISPPKPDATAVHRILVAWKGVKTFFIVIVVLVFCCFVPTVVGRPLLYTCSEACQQVWYVVVNYELYGINSIVNPFIYGMRHLKYRRAYGYIIVKLFHCIYRK